MNMRWIMAFFLSLFFLKDLVPIKAALPSGMEEGHICTTDVMKMTCTYHISSPKTALQVAEKVQKHSLLFKLLRPRSIEEHSKGFSGPFLKKVIEYVSLLQKGYTREQIIASESMPQFVHVQELGKAEFIFSAEAFQAARDLDAPKEFSNLWAEDFSSQSTTPISYGYLREVFFQPQESKTTTPSEQHFGKSHLAEYLIFLFPKNLLFNNPVSGSPDSSITPSGPENFLRSFKEMAEHFYTASLKISAKQLAFLEEEEEVSLSSSLLKPLLETPLALVLSYIASFFMLIIGSFADLRLGTTTFGMAFSRGYTQVSVFLSYFTSFWEDWCVRNGLLPRQAFIRRV